MIEVERMWRKRRGEENKEGRRETRRERDKRRGEEAREETRRNFDNWFRDAYENLL